VNMKPFCGSFCIVIGGFPCRIRWFLLFSRTRWPRDHYGHAGLLAAMNDMLLLGGLHCPQSK
jgi:hypothetical protein